MKKAYKILIVEDDLKLQRVLNDKIEQEGWQSAVAIDGEEGLRRIEEFKPDIVLLDLRLPRMGGMEMLAAARKKYSRKELPVIVLTNYGDADNISQSLELQAEAFMIKSNYSLQEVIDKINSILKSRQA